MHNLNASGRAMHDAIVAMDIDTPNGDSFEYQVLTPSKDFAGTHGDGKVHLLGITGIDGPGQVDLFFDNIKPSVDTQTGQLLDNKALGPNATIEHFTVSTSEGTSEMKYVKTFSHPLIATPNNMAMMDRNSFYFTNDHGTAKTGLASIASPLLYTGDVSYCHFDPTTQSQPACKKVAGGLSFPNGPVRDHDGLLYVPSALAGGIRVYSIDSHDHSLTPVGTVDLPYGMDNLAADAAGTVWAPVFPKQGEALKAFADPLGAKTPVSAAFKIVKTIDAATQKTTWQAVKVIEDKAGEILPGSTCVIHDVRTGRLFFSSVYSPFISVCEPR
nr:serum paraoxonase/arylesterase 1 [Quercus suber]